MPKSIIGKKKILFLSHYFPPEGNAPASRVHEMTREWVKDGHDVTVLTCAPNCPNGVVYKGYKNKFLHKEVVDGIKVIRVWTYIAANKGAMLRILNYITFMVSAVFMGLFVKKPDVIIATSPQFFCGWAGVILKKIRRLPFILEIRDIWPESIVAVGAITNKRVIRFLEMLEKKMYAAATHIITVGDGYKQQLIAKGVDPDNISVVTNGVDLAFFSPRSQDNSLRKSHGINGEFVCAYIGTLGMASGLNVVLNAAKILKARKINHIKMMLIGDGAIKGQLENDAKNSGLDNIIFTGRQPKEMMPRYLASIDTCLIHLRRTDLFKTVLPSKIFEAAAMERPIILGVEGSAAELVQEADAGICIEPENANELVEAVLKLNKDQQLAERYGKAARRYVNTHHDRSVLARNYIEHIHLILAKHSVKYAKETVEYTRETILEQQMKTMRPTKLAARQIDTYGHTDENQPGSSSVEDGEYSDNEASNILNRRGN